MFSAETFALLTGSILASVLAGIGIGLVLERIWRK